MLVAFQPTTTCGNAYSVNQFMITCQTTNKVKPYEYVIVNPAVDELLTIGQPTKLSTYA